MAKFMTPVITTVMVAAAIGAMVSSPNFLSNQDNKSGAAGQQRSNERAIPVILQPVLLEPERTRIEAVGTSRAIRSITLYPAAAGEVVAVNFKANQAVSAGELLVELDRRDAELALASARVQVADAERLLTRYERSAGSGAVPPSTVDSTRTALATARIEQQRAAVALEDRSIEAPFSGIVGITEVELGDRIDPDVAITTLDDRSELLVSFEVPELFFDRIKTGETVAIARWTADAIPVEGRISDVASRIDPDSRTLVVRAKVRNPDDRLRPGMSFRVTLNLEGKRYPVVPEVAVQWGGDGAYIWIAQNNMAHRVDVNIVQRREGRVLVAADLAEGVPVVVEGVQRMREGLRVGPLIGETDDDQQLGRNSP